MNPVFAEPLHRTGQYRVLKSQGGPIAPRFLEHASPSDANIYSGSMVPAPPTLRPHEPLCAYLNMEMQVSKVTQSFSDTIGVQSLVGRKLQDLVGGSEREKVVRLQRILEDERRQREPNYLPPILLKFEEDRVIQSVGFGPEDIGQLRLDHPEIFTFPGPEGQQRMFHARFGLAKKESTYFIVMVLQVPANPQAFTQPALSPYTRDPQYNYHAPQYPQSQAPSSFMANPAFQDPRREPMGYRTPGPSNMPSASMPPFSQPPSRPDYSQAQNPYQTPRSELSQGQPQRQHDHLQLPPIRDQRSEAVDPMRMRDDRSNRVDIGGLLETPHSTRGR
jgi:hypothetical protein